MRVVESATWGGGRRRGEWVGGRCRGLGTRVAARQLGEEVGGRRLGPRSARRFWEVGNMEKTAARLGSDGTGVEAGALDPMGRE